MEDKYFPIRRFYYDNLAQALINKRAWYQLPETAGPE